MTFYDALFPYLFIKSVKTAQALPGRFGACARATFKNRHDCEFDIKDNVISDELMFSWSGQEYVDVTVIPQKYTNSVCVSIHEGNDKEVDEAICDRIRNRHAEYFFRIHCATVGKTWIDWACRWPFTGLELYERLDDSTFALCNNLLKTRRLTQILVESVACTEQVVEWMKELLCQEQFETVYIQDSAVVEELLDFWIAQHKQMVKKHLNIYGTCEEAAQLLEGKLETCSSEECNTINSEYLFFYRAMFENPSNAYKLKKEGQFGVPNHNVYVFFECDGKDANRDELDFMRETSSMRILFG
uniref:FBA_2 domain-containing protein n=1 Tax=Steinernema glaseri TaxID=37863 RepID=A0A1I8A946_9BILA